MPYNTYSLYLLLVLHGVRLYFSISVRVRARQWCEYTVDLSGDSEGRSELGVVDKDQFY
jgi:hypothetical protein